MPPHKPLPPGARGESAAKKRRAGLRPPHFRALLPRDIVPPLFRSFPLSFHTSQRTERRIPPLFSPHPQAGKDRAKTTGRAPIAKFPKKSARRALRPPSFPRNAAYLSPSKPVSITAVTANGSPFTERGMPTISSDPPEKTFPSPSVRPFSAKISARNRVIPISPSLCGSLPVTENPPTPLSAPANPTGIAELYTLPPSPCEIVDFAVGKHDGKCRFQPFPDIVRFFSRETNGGARRPALLIHGALHARFLRQPKRRPFRIRLPDGHRRPRQSKDDGGEQNRHRRPHGMPSEALRAESDCRLYGQFSAFLFLSFFPLVRRIPAAAVRRDLPLL